MSQHCAALLHQVQSSISDMLESMFSNLFVSKHIILYHRSYTSYKSIYLIFFSGLDFEVKIELLLLIFHIIFVLRLILKVPPSHP